MFHISSDALLRRETIRVSALPQAILALGFIQFAHEQQEVHARRSRPQRQRLRELLFSAILNSIRLTRFDRNRYSVSELLLASLAIDTRFSGSETLCAAIRSTDTRYDLCRSFLGRTVRESQVPAAAVATAVVLLARRRAPPSSIQRVLPRFPHGTPGSAESAPQQLPGTARPITEPVAPPVAIPGDFVASAGNGEDGTGERRIREAEVADSPENSWFG